MTAPAIELRAANDFVTRAEQFRSAGKIERVLIDNLTSHLRGMFPDAPAWVDEHIRDAEEQVRYAEGGYQRRAHIDNIVGYTTIEYEHDLRKDSVFSQGHRQVRQHLSGMLNKGAPPDKLIGLLSDTVSWRAYRIKAITGSGYLGPNDIELEEIEHLELSASDNQAGERIRDFMQRYLAREGARVLKAETVAEDLGFQSVIAQRHVTQLEQIVSEALADRPAYAQIIGQLWSSFVGYVGVSDACTFDQEMYVSELYVVTLAKLICANVIDGKALHSDVAELGRILDGSHFQAKGLANLVEYDYFGWLNAAPYAQRIIPLADELQRALRRFDFESPAAEDLFGRLMAQLAQRSQRLLLGQECTPPWLAQRMAAQLVAGLPAGEQPRFIDMCCGSGPMIVEVIKLAKNSLPASSDPVDELRQVATGFDIDPLAVMLAKVNWVVATRDELPLDGSRELTIPIYHADSMFTKTPVSIMAGDQGVTSYELTLDAHKIKLPAFLVSPQQRALFDALIDVCYRIAIAAAAQPAGVTVSAHDIQNAVHAAITSSRSMLNAQQQREVEQLSDELVKALEALQRAELNGIWAFVLRNSYRPGLVAGQFNGLITNPPWLALSKIADNPYQKALQQYATGYGIKPGGPAHLHTELATTFLLHAVDRYLIDGAVIACVLPETVLNGHHHDPFRKGEFATSAIPVKLNPTELWRIAAGTFKNEAIVLLGRKAAFVPAASYPGLEISEHGDAAMTFDVKRLGSVRSAWSDEADGGRISIFAQPEFRQGADLMPRTAVFHETSPRTGDQFNLNPIDQATSPLRYLVAAAKKLKDFKVTPNTVQACYVYDALTSAHLSPFELADPAKALLPFTRASDGGWTPATPVELAIYRGSQAVFNEILHALGQREGIPWSLARYQDALDYRGKLTLQAFSDPDQFLVVFGAGGSKPTIAFAPLARFDCERLVIDQTLYYRLVDSEGEAIYLAGLLNSEALERLILEYQPRGAFGRRHIHTLPLSVTPAFDPSQALHEAVVDATRALMAEIHTARSSIWPSRWFDPNSPLHVRRPRVFGAIEGLPAYEAYDDACSALYGVRTAGKSGG